MINQINGQIVPHSISKPNIAPSSVRNNPSPNFTLFHDQLALKNTPRQPLPLSPGQLFNQPLSSSVNTYTNALNSNSHAIGTVSLDVLSLNVYGLVKPIGKDIKVRATRIGKSLGGYDIVGLQETFSRETNSIYETARKNGLNFNRFKPKNRFLTNSGLTTLSKHPIIKSDFQPFLYATHADALAKKGVTFNRINVPGVGPVDFYNTHYQAGGMKQNTFFQKLMVKLGSFFMPGFNLDANLIKNHDNQMLIKFVKDNDQGYPIFITGDFNTRDDNSRYFNLIRELNIKDSYREANPNDPGYTSDGKLNPLKGNKNSRSRIDYVFYKPGEFIDVNVDHSRVAFNQAIDGRFVSDHFGVHTKFKLFPKQLSTSRFNAN